MSERCPSCGSSAFRNKHGDLLPHTYLGESTVNKYGSIVPNVMVCEATKKGARA